MLPYSGEINIPSELDGKKVVAIGQEAFRYCTALTNVTIPTGVTKIGADAFSGCTSLSKMTLRSAVIPEVGLNAFYNCKTGLTMNTYPRYVETLKATEPWSTLFSTYTTDITHDGSVVGEDGNTYYYYEFADAVEITYGDVAPFKAMTNKHRWRIPASINDKPVKGISNDAFCTDFVSLYADFIYIPASVEVIRDRAFSFPFIHYIVCYAAVPPKVAENAFENVFKSYYTNYDLSDIMVWVYKDYKDAYKNDSMWSKLTISTNVSIDDQEYESNGYKFYYKSVENGYEITRIDKLSDANGIIVIPDEINEYPFISISGAMPEDITSVSIPKSITNIADNVFSSCTTIETLKLNLPNVGTWFSGMTSLKSVLIDKDVQTIAEGAFDGCENIENLQLCVSSVGTWFRNLPNLKVLTLSDDVQTVADEAFSGCTAVTDFTIGNSLTTVGTDAFAAFKNSVKNLTIDCANVENWFAESSSLAHVNILSNARTIKEYAFSKCYALEDVTIEEGLEAIYQFAFNNCSKLHTVLLPSTVNTLDAGVFYYCTSLHTVNIPFGITNLAVNLFIQTAITTIEIPSTVETIEFNAFASCGKLESIVFPVGVKYIKSTAFYNCYGLKSIVFSSSVTNIDETAFNKCDAIESIEFNQETVSGWFKERPSIKSLTFNANVKTIEAEAFMGCNGLTKVTIPSNVTEIGYRAFAYCNNLTDFEVADLNTQYLGIDGVVYDKQGTTILFYPSGRTSATIPAEKVSTIDAYSFYGCNKIESIIIPENISYINSYAFKDCTALKSVKCYKYDVPSTMSNSFEGCDLASATLYVHEESLGKYKGSDPWSNFGTITDMNCEIPTITYDEEDGALQFYSSTPGAVYHYTIENEDVATDQPVDNGRVILSGRYDVSAYASAEGYDNSKTVTASLFFLPNPQGDDITTEVIEVPEMRGILAYSNNGFITITGLNNLEYVSFYDLNGTKLGAVSAYNGVATFKAEVGSVVIATFTHSSIKILVR